MLFAAIPQDGGFRNKKRNNVVNYGLFPAFKSKNSSDDLEAAQLSNDDDGEEESSTPPTSLSDADSMIDALVKSRRKARHRSPPTSFGSRNSKNGVDILHILEHLPTPKSKGSLWANNNSPERPHSPVDSISIEMGGSDTLQSDLDNYDDDDDDEDSDDRSRLSEPLLDTEDDGDDDNRSRLSAPMLLVMDGDVSKQYYDLTTSQQGVSRRPGNQQLEQQPLEIDSEDHSFLKSDQTSSESTAGGLGGRRRKRWGPGQFLLRTYQSYERSLEERPLLTKSITAGIVTGLGDVLAQVMEHWAKVRTEAMSYQRQQIYDGAADAPQTPFVPIVLLFWMQLRLLNVHRMLTFAAVGAIYVGPYMHTFYEQLWAVGNRVQKLYPSLSKTWIIALQVLMDQTIGVSLFYPPYFYVYEVVEASLTFRVPQLAVATAKLQKDLLSVIAMQYRLWPIANIVNFGFVPERFRVLFTNLVAVFWNMFLCAKLAASS